MGKLAWRFFFWITPRWLSKKWQVYMLRRIVERYPAEVDRKLRESARAMAQRFGTTGPSEEELVAFHKRGLDLILHPQADAQGSSKSGYIGSAENTMPIQLQLRDNCLKDCLDELSKRFEVAFQRKGARLETEFEPSIPNFRFDYLKVQQAAANLLDHALRQAPSSSTVTLHCLSRPEGVEVSLTGATAHDREVFDKCPTPYSRPHHQESLDVGLSIVQRLILAHRGRIWVEPSPTGSKFVFLLPMDASRAQQNYERRTCPDLAVAVSCFPRVHLGLQLSRKRQLFTENGAALRVAEDIHGGSVYRGDSTTGKFVDAFSRFGPFRYGLLQNTARRTRVLPQDEKTVRPYRNPKTKG